MQGFKFLKTIGKLLLLFVITILLVVLSFYLLAPSYQFEEPKPFSGSILYNPYQNIDSLNLYKYNFQVQSKAWGGITDGRLNSNELIDSIYKGLGFDHVATSDYQKINRYQEESQAYIPTYEHGYGIRKTHQVCIGASRVLWLDYPFYQSLRHKQHIINKLQEDCELIALAHPVLRNGYTYHDMKYLSGYQLMEVLNNIRLSVPHWDTALSHGHRIYMLANDDAHDVSNSNEVGRRFTMIFANNQNRAEIVQSLDEGKAYGMDFFRIGDEPMLEKFERSKHIPYLVSAKLNLDTLIVVVSKQADSLSFIGQNGLKLHNISNTESGTYIIKESDTYVRTEIYFDDGSVMYLNPITRHKDQNDLKRQSLSKPDLKGTWLIRSGNILLLALLFLIVIRRRSKSKKSMH
ncbi:MAG: hypothetical protein PHG67_01785 [Bacteroidales bacterium]|jgi:hypothetical protein|nr:hypothetical protein [Bacteroidales bacterium]